VVNIFSVFSFEQGSILPCFPYRIIFAQELRWIFFQIFSFKSPVNQAPPAQVEWFPGQQSMKKVHVLNAIAAVKAIAVVRLPDPDDVIPVVEAIVSGGITVIEISWAMEGAANIIKKLSAFYDDKQDGSQVVIGAGSVLSALDAKRAIKAGAHFIISPLFKKDIIEEIENNL
jgi:hypothetical protein